MKWPQLEHNLHSQDVICLLQSLFDLPGRWVIHHVKLMCLLCLLLCAAYYDSVIWQRRLSCCVAKDMSLASTCPVCRGSAPLAS